MNFYFFFNKRNLKNEKLIDKNSYGFYSKQTNKHDFYLTLLILVIILLVAVL